MFAPRPSLLEGPVGPHLLRLGWPMVFGLAAVILFNVVDTFYVGQLGAAPLAAMGFTFPVVFFVMSIAMGMGVGTSSVVSRAIGQGDRNQVRRLTTHALLLANGLVVLVAGVGIATLDPLFTALGATAELLPMIRQYMVPWYLGVGFVVIPMVGNAAIRANGDTKTPSMVMMLSGGLNLVLDPLLIFGVGPFPRMELQGAAVATVISYGVTFLASLWLLSRREKMITWDAARPAGLGDSARQLLYVGLPAAGANVMLPVATGVVTRLVSAYGPAAVAAYGVGSRLDSLAVIGLSALATALAPFVGQNIGAGRVQRVASALRFAARGSWVYGLGMAALVALLARPLAGLFSDDPAVQTMVVRYLWVVPVAYVAYGWSTQCSSVLNAMNKPVHSAVLIVVRLFMLQIPLVVLGGHLAGVWGIFGGLTVGRLLGGAITYAVARWVVQAQARRCAGEREVHNLAAAS